MPITLEKMASNTASVTIQSGEDSATIVYYPGRVTDKILAQIKALGSLDEDSALEGLEAFNGTIASLIKSWDIYEDAKATRLLPITAEGISAIPYLFRVQMVTAILGDINPEEIAPQMKTQS